MGGDRLRWISLQPSPLGKGDRLRWMRGLVAFPFGEGAPLAVDIFTAFPVGEGGPLAVDEECLCQPLPSPRLRRPSPKGGLNSSVFLPTRLELTEHLCYSIPACFNSQISTLTNRFLHSNRPPAPSKNSVNTVKSVKTSIRSINRSFPMEHCAPPRMPQTRVRVR